MVAGIEPVEADSTAATRMVPISARAARGAANDITCQPRRGQPMAAQHQRTGPRHRRQILSRSEMPTSPASDRPRQGDAPADKAP